ncbi:MAG TPA: hypothetical protein VGR16_06635, partial [Thermomicrobiales bacterium]|nr:hypothetical protein [Thermomicrobiales bacterium]
MIPRRADEREPNDYDTDPYRERPLIERMIDQLKRFRQVATHAEKRTANYLAIVPITRFAADPDNHYFGHFRGVSIFEQAAWENLANPLDRGIFLVERYATFWRRTCCDPQVNGVDGTGVVPVRPLPLLVLVIVGITIGLWRRPGPLLTVGALIVAAMPWAAVTT